MMLDPLRSWGAESATSRRRGNSNMITMNDKDTENRFQNRSYRFCAETMAQWTFILFALTLLAFPPICEYQIRPQADPKSSTDSATELRTPSKKKPVIPRESERLPVFTGQTDHRFDHLIHKVANRYDVDPALVKAIIKAESGYNPKAISKRGAKGLMQLMPGTAKALGVKDCFNPEHNINGGVKYFKELLERFNGNVKLSLAAYNAGARKVRLYGGVPPFKATRYYVEKVFEYYSLYKRTMTGKVGTV